MNTVNLFGLRFNNVDLVEVVDHCEVLLRTGNQGLIIPTNVDVIVKRSRDRAFQVVYERANLIVADGAPVVWASRLFGKPLKSRVAGSDLLPALCERAAQRGWRLFFLGAMPGVAHRAANRLANQFPGLNVVGTYAPPFGFESDLAECQRIVTMIRTARPDILFVGLGAPKQEKWSAAHLEALGVPIILCIGAGFDFAAGVVRRAPLWMQKIGLEWLFRLLQDPKRLWRRYLIHNLAFIAILFSEWRGKLER